MLARDRAQNRFALLLIARWKRTPKGGESRRQQVRV